MCTRYISFDRAFGWTAATAYTLQLDFLDLQIMKNADEGRASADCAVLVKAMFDLGRRH